MMTPPAILLFDLLVKATLLFAAAHLLLVVVRKASAGTRHLVLTSALVASLALPLTSPFLGLVELPVLPSSLDTSPLPANRLTIRLPMTDEASGSLPESAIPPQAVDDPARPSEGSVAESESTVSLPIISFASVTDWVKGMVRSALLPLFIWMAGAVALLLYLVIGMLRMQWVAERALPAEDDDTLTLVSGVTRRLELGGEPKVLITPDLTVPVVWGLWRPVLLLPLESVEWTDDRREAVLLHEFAHIARRDGLTLILSRIATSLYWIHPLSWTAARLARRYCERACDDIVLQRGAVPSTYANHLLAIAQTLPDRERLVAVTLAMSRRSEIEGRLLAILHPNLRRGSITRRSWLMASLTTATVLLAVGSFRITAGEPPKGGTSPADTVESPATVDADLELTVEGAGVDPEDAALWDLDLDNRDDVAAEEWSGSSSNTNWNTNWNSSTNWSGNGSSGESDTSAKREEKSDRKDAEKASSVNKEREAEGAKLWEKAWNAHQQNRFGDSIPLFIRTAELGYRTRSSYYNVACGYARQGDAGRAVEWLRLAVDEGLDDWNLLAKDSDLDPIRSSSTFREFIDTLPGRGRKAESAARTRTEKILVEYNALRQSRSRDASEWGEVGRQLLQLRRFDEAEIALRRGIELSKSPPVISMYDMACLEALRGNTGQAISWLDRAIESGLDRPDAMRSDPDLASLRSIPQFEALLRKSHTLSLERYWKEEGDEEPLPRRVERWKPAIDDFTRYTRSHPDSGRAWWNLGWARHASGMYQPAIDAFERARSLGYRPANSSYNIACGHARLGRHDLAFQWLERASQLGFEMGDRIRWDSDLASLRDDPRRHQLFE